MSKRIFGWTILGWLACASAWAQTADNFRLLPANDVPVLVGSDTLRNAWAGGMNAVQFANFPLDDDDVPDLLVFDRASNQLRTYRAVPTATGYEWVYHPQYEPYFPELDSWIRVADYDGDGRPDLFTQTRLPITWSVRIYRNVTPPGGPPAFELFRDGLLSTLASAPGQVADLPILAGDIPAIADVNGDGLLDVLTYGTGGLFEYHKNNGDFTFEKRSNCWGNFREIICTEVEFDFFCGFDFERPGPTTPAPPKGPPTDEKVLHMGSTVLAYDLTDNGALDLLLGDSDCTQLLQLSNTGERDKASITAVDTLYPPNTRPVDMLFPAAHLADVNFDGTLDLLVSPNEASNVAGGQLYGINFRQSSWYYQNVGTNQLPVFDFRQEDFLQGGMIEVGENATPALADYDGDGDLDLFVGQFGDRDAANTLRAGVSLYQNVGTPTRPAFRWVTDDYLGLRAEGFFRLKPLFHDLDGDGRPDLLVVANTSIRDAAIYWWPNRAPVGATFDFRIEDRRVLEVTIGPEDCPAFGDLTGDGRAELLVGRLDGSLHLFRQTRNGENPAFDLVSDTLGGLTRARPDLLKIALADLDGNGTLDLLTTDLTGQLTVYGSVRPDAPWTPQTHTRPFGDSTVRAAYGQRFLAPAVADLYGDGRPGVVLGTSPGGLRWLRNLSTEGSDVPPPPPDAADQLVVFPNPARESVALQLTGDADVAVFDVTGRMVQQLGRMAATPTGGAAPSLNVRGWAAGTYIFRARFAQSGQWRAQRVVLLP